MPANYYIFLFIFFAIVLLFLYQKGAIFASFESLEPKEADDMLKKDKNGTLILDVRTEHEHKNDGRIDGAILIPVQNLSNQLSKLEAHKRKKILVHCRSGMRSVSACRILTSSGFKAYNLKGGITNWKNSGYKVK
jgi:phage shock protein E